MVTTSSLPSSFIYALVSDGPAPDRVEKMALYGRFVGRWEMDTVRYLKDGSTHRGKGEIHFAWALQGRAVQDVWIVPTRGPEAHDPAPGDFYGTTLRIYDPSHDYWHIFWTDPLFQIYRSMIGRPEGADIVQHGTDEIGRPERWSFRDITDDSFHWRAERARNPEAEFDLVVEFFARRIG
jgi:hypothetical protein